jgi:hypothetical protein
VAAFFCGGHFYLYTSSSEDHSVLGVCFVAFLIGRSDAFWAVGGRDE